MILLALLATRDHVAAHVPQLVAVVRLAVLGVVAAARCGVVPPADVILRLLLPLLLLLAGVEVDERARALAFPGSPGVRELVRRQERQLVLPV
jgi:hypothetical protein